MVCVLLGLESGAGALVKALSLLLVLQQVAEVGAACHSERPRPVLAECLESVSLIMTERLGLVKLLRIRVQRRQPPFIWTQIQQWGDVVDIFQDAHVLVLVIEDADISHIGKAAV